MATEVKRTLYITADNAGSLCDSDGLTFANSGNAFWLSGKMSGSAKMNGAAMSELYPTRDAHPHRLDITAESVRHTSIFPYDTNHIDVTFDGTVVWTELTKYIAMDHNATGVVNDAIGRSTAASDLRLYLYASATAVTPRCKSASFTLYFWRYAFAAAAAGEGVESAGVSAAEAYEGDSVTYTAALKPGAAWHGWYADAACTQLVSTEQSYTVTAGADLTLYAYAASTGGTGLYLREGGSYAEVQRVWRRENGVYVQVEAAELDAGARYKRA